MRRKGSVPSLKSDSGVDDFLELPNDEGGSIFMADAMSSGDSSEIEKDGTEDGNYGINEGTSLLSTRPTYGSVNIKQNKEEVPVYASPARPHLPSPSASNNAHPGKQNNFRRKLMVVSMYLPYNWRTPAMVPYDVEAHPFNRAPNATPPVTVTRSRYGASDTDFTGESSRSSVWSVELEEGTCGCVSG
jgi:hypothetical protein